MCVVLLLMNDNTLSELIEILMHNSSSKFGNANLIDHDQKLTSPIAYGCPFGQTVKERNH